MKVWTLLLLSSILLPILSCTTIARKPAFTPEMQVECGQGTVESRPYKWCITREKDGTNPDLLFFLHGKDGNEHSWQDVDQQLIANAWKQMGLSAPSVITISFGPNWYMDNDKIGLVVHKIFPALEKKISSNGKRALYGRSMGGHNAANLYLKKGRLFDRVALACPAISTVSPFSPPEQVQRFIETHDGAVDANIINDWLLRMRIQFLAPRVWRQYDPLTLVNKISEQGPLLFISAGDRDPYGFFTGAKAFAERAQQRDPRVEWVPIRDGGHCTQTAESLDRLARFLIGEVNVASTLHNF